MSPERRADVFVDPDEDPREGGTTLGDEKATLIEFIRFQRLTLELKCQGLEATQMATRSVEPSTMSLLGLVRHMAAVERNWFKRRLANLDVPKLYQTEEDPDGDFNGAIANDDLVAEAWRSWRDEVAFSAAYVEQETDLGRVYDIPNHGQLSLREVLVHMVEEYARHNGHADLLRERIDGRVGQ